MQDPLETCQRIFVACAGNEYAYRRLWELAECLYSDLERERASTANLQRQIMQITKEEAFGISSKFAALKVEYNKLKQAVEELKNENEDLNLQLIAKGEETKKLLAENEESLKTYFTSQMKQKDEIIKQKVREIEDSKVVCEETQRKLYSDIQAAEAASAVELDKAETEFRKQLDEANKKIKDSMDTCTVLRMELLSVKEQFAEDKRRSNQKIAELQRRLKVSQSFDAELLPSVSQDTRSWCSGSNVNIPVNIEDKISKYQPLDISSKKHEILADTPINLNKGSVGPNARQIVSNNCRATRHILSPLVNLTDKEGDTPVNKRRKLFNPDDLSYLNVDVTNLE